MQTDRTNRLSILNLLMLYISFGFDAFQLNFVQFHYF